MRIKYETVIGLEIHAQLLTETKIFCGCSTKFGSEPNSNICPICLGHPGVLPKLNYKVVEFAVKMGLATNCSIRKDSVLARKNYFYPDLPKGYQISQFDKPICENGYIMVYPKGLASKKIRITRIHIEEDAGKSIHDRGNDTFIDVNRCGVPLIEIVSEPDISTAEEATLYLAKIRQLVRYLGICDANMEEGSLRCDANISIRPEGQKELGTKSEIKNMNSFRNVERAIAYEVQRQTEVLEDGGRIIQQTLLWDADANEAHPMRNKEDAHDYRYFPDPDLEPIIISDSLIDEIKQSIPELPETKRERFITSYGLPEFDADNLTQDKLTSEYFENTAKFVSDAKLASNWVMVEVQRVLNEKKLSISEFSISPERLGKMISMIEKNVISGKIAKDVFAFMLEDEKDAEQIVKEKNLVQITDDGFIKTLIAQLIEKFPDELQQYREGKEKVFGFFVGQVMKESKGKASPQIVNTLLKEMLK